MVTSATLFTLGLVSGLAPVLLVTAAPKPNPVGTTDIAASDSLPKLFSFEQWVLDKIENPETALSPEQALEAYSASVNATLEARGTDTAAAVSGPVNRPQARDNSGSRLLHKRVVCDDQSSPRVPAPQAVWCINRLAGLGQTACVVEPLVINFCTMGSCAIAGSRWESDGVLQSPW